MLNIFKTFSFLFSYPFSFPAVSACSTSNLAPVVIRPLCLMCIHIILGQCNLTSTSSGTPRIAKRHVSFLSSLVLFYAVKVNVWLRHYVLQCLMHAGPPQPCCSVRCEGNPVLLWGTGHNLFFISLASSHVMLLRCPFQHQCSHFCHIPSSSCVATHPRLMPTVEVSVHPAIRPRVGV